MQTKAVVDYIVDWLKTYAENANQNGFVVGISGGIDSAVTSTLCARTGLEVICLELPIHQPSSHVSRAKEHVDFLKNSFKNVSGETVNLTATFDRFKRTVPKHKDTNTLNLALANARARLRMTTLYYYAGLNTMLVAGTGNKVEDFGIGFYTKYGDGGVDLSPIADLYKSEVYDIGKYLNVPQSILDAPPSDGLFEDDRSDEDQIGATYPELEWAMLMKEQGKTIDDFKGRQYDVFEIYNRLNTSNQHKMNPIPICKIDESLK